MRIIVGGKEQPTRKPAERDRAEQRPSDDRPRDRALMSWVPSASPRRRGIERSR
ncbi:hypothetical protein [Nocardia salmonicida]|uniref:hypothetical protein n=1 Tax=Nocardia salmonicida TaxID=53431 RepID=UPI000AD77332|nr:hypothetical protein [Nocardia salmonicida]